MTQPSLTLTDGITLLSGKVFDFNNPEAAEINLDDIAIPLSNNCRYAGQLPLGRWYSVAQHAVNTSYIVPLEHAFTALLHDTAEAFTNDIVTPLKVAVPLFKQLELIIERDMARRFGFEFPLPPEVKLADLQMLGLEMKNIRGQDPKTWAILDGIEFDHLLPLVSLESWTPRQAYYNFISRFEELQADK